jgi:hypothetical protein
VLSGKQWLTAIGEDGSEPGDLATIVERLDASAVHEGAVQAPSPIDDIFDCLAEKGDEARDAASAKLGRIQAAPEAPFIRNGARAGVSSLLALIEVWVITNVFGSLEG